MKLCDVYNILFQVEGLMDLFTPQILDLLSILLSVPNEETIKCVNKVLKVRSLMLLIISFSHKFVFYFGRFLFLF